MSVQVMSTLTRAVSWTVGVIEGMVAGVVPPRLPALMAAGRMADLRSALVGRHRRNIARALGAPPTACLGFGVCVARGRPVTYWQATTWYYPVSPNRRQAIAIQFDGNRARQVDFIGLEN